MSKQTFCTIAVGWLVGLAGSTRRMSGEEENTSNKMKNTVIDFENDLFTRFGKCFEHMRNKINVVFMSKQTFQSIRRCAVYCIHIIIIQFQTLYLSNTKAMFSHILRIKINEVGKNGRVSISSSGRKECRELYPLFHGCLLGPNTAIK